MQRRVETPGEIHRMTSSTDRTNDQRFGVGAAG
jgi:hypothetical protein